MTTVLSIPPGRPEDISMDYDLLREEGIRHLEELASKIWTDLNAHDPGITILEVLCYALVDLGYRANLPIEELLAGPNGESDFFSISESLPNGPVTSKDYRKLLIDIEQVKNAWLYKYYNSPINGEPQPLNGLYHLLLELDDGIHAESKAAKRIIKAVKSRYHQHRNLAEDLGRISVVRDCPFCFCLDLEVEPGLNTAEVVAQVMFNLQEWVAPTPRFHSFLELREAGVACEDILDGPLLKNGFLPDAELARSPLRRKLYLSDVVHVIMETEGVISIRDIKWKKVGEGEGPNGNEFTNAICLDFEDCQSGPSAGDDPCRYFYQPYLDLCCSRINVNVGLISEAYGEDDYKEELDLLHLERDIPVDTSVPRPAKGRYREDLADYASVQTEFPENYALGEDGLPTSADALRRAQVKQLRTYLAFFDQILAAYLQQLAGVRDLLSVKQDPDAPTYLYSTLCEVPGMEELVADFVVYDLSDERVEAWIEANEPADELANRLRNLPNTIAARRPIGQSIFEQMMISQLGLARWRQQGSVLNAAFRTEPTTEDWMSFCEAGEGVYFDSLGSLAESPNQSRLRRNRIMDHLLARFGEQFTQYSLELFSTRVERENDPNTIDFQEYLGHKADFLCELPTLISERARAFNYRQKHPTTGEQQVWNTDNVPGLKKRVSRLLGIDDYSARSLQCDPGYDLRIRKGESRSGLPNYQLILVNREDNKVLLESKVYSSRQKKRALEIQETFRQLIDNREYYRLKSVNGKWQVIFKAPVPPDGGEQAIEKLKSPMFNSEALALQWQTAIMEIIEGEDCQREGFHLVEHLLLRPNDSGDTLLDLKGCTEDFDDQYSFVVTVVLPDWPRRFQDVDFRRYVEQLFRREAPAHIYLRFCWQGKDSLQEFERAFQRWRIALAECEPDECEVNTWANRLIDWMNNVDCPCATTAETSSTFCEGREESDGEGPATSTGRTPTYRNPDSQANTHKTARQ